MSLSAIRRIWNRALHLLARSLPGALSVRPRLHRLRGVKIGDGVFIGDEVYIENEHPEAVEIHSGAQISLRAIIIAHTRGIGGVVVEKDVFIGPNAIIASSGNGVLRIGEGAVIGAGVVVTGDVPPGVFVANVGAKAVATVGVPLTRAATMEEFVRGLAPIRKSSQPPLARGDSERS